MIDYQDFLRNHQLPEWDINHPYSQRLQQLNRTKNPSYGAYKQGIEHSSPEICANVMIGLIRATTSLLQKQIKFLEKDFLENGGIKERMTKARLATRKQRRDFY